MRILVLYAQRLNYHKVPANQAPVAAQVFRLRRAEALVLCFPVWGFGLPRAQPDPNLNGHQIEVGDIAHSRWGG